MTNKISEPTQALAEQLKSRWKRGRCPMCDNTTWTIIGFAAMTHDDPKFGPIALAVCDNCGFSPLITTILAPKKSCADA